MNEKTKIEFMMSQLDNLDGLGLKLYWTPGAARPYWASQPSFAFDVCVAHPSDFLEAAGYNCFVDDRDYSGYDELLSLEIEPPPAGD